MKTRVYLRIAKTARGRTKVVASSKPSYAALDNGQKYHHEVYPTVTVALDLDIPEEEFSAARILLKKKIEKTTPAVDIHIVGDEGQ